MCVSSKRNGWRDRAIFENREMGPKMLMEGVTRHTSSTNTLNVQLHMEELPLKKKKPQDGLSDSCAAGNEREFCRMKLLSAAGKCPECFTSKMSRNFLITTTLWTKKGSCVDPTRTVLPRYNLSKFNIIQLLKTGNEPVCSILILSAASWG